ncbi:unnamed protein product [Musa banksii]
MSLYDLAAVLLPGGPLRLLVELAISRDEELPALVYEARPVEHLPGAGTRLWRERRDLASNSSSNSNILEAGDPASQDTSLVIAEEGPSVSALTAPFLQQQLERHGEVELEGIGLSSSGIASSASVHSTRYNLLSLDEGFIGSVYGPVFDKSIDVLAWCFSSFQWKSEI